MVCRTKARVTLWLIPVLTNPPIIKWWTVMSGYSIGLVWVETDSCTLLLLWKKSSSWVFLRMDGLFYIKNVFSIWHFSSSKALLKTSFVNNMGVSSRLCYFSIDGKQKRNGNAKKIKLPRRKTWEEFSFPAPFFFSLFYYTPVQRILRSDSKPVEMNRVFPVTSVSFGSGCYWNPVVNFDNIIWSNCSVSILLLPFKSEWCHKRSRIWIHWKQLLLFFKLVSQR